MGFVVEKITAPMLFSIAELEKECFSEPWSEDSLKMLVAENAFGFAVLLDGRAIAYGGMMTVLDEGQITNIAVSSEYRRRGLGRAVTEALLEYAVNKGIVSVSLEVRASNVPAIALYESLGFTRCGVRKNFYRMPTENALVMVWNKENT